MLSCQRKLASRVVTLVISSITPLGPSLRWGDDLRIFPLTTFTFPLTMITQFDNVSLSVKANVYFDGKCVSYNFIAPDGAKKSVGVIFPAKLNFGTGAPELMEIVSGQCKIKPAGSNDWQTYGAGQAFNVPGNSSFDIEVVETVNYICHYG